MGPARAAPQPFGLLDVAGYYRPLAMLDHAVEQRFMRAETRAMLVARVVRRLLARFEAWQPAAGPKWIDREAS